LAMLNIGLCGFILKKFIRGCGPSVSVTGPRRPSPSPVSRPASRQGARAARVRGARVPGCQGARVPGCQGARVRGSPAPRLPGSPWHRASRHPRTLYVCACIAQCGNGAGMREDPGRGDAGMLRCMGSGYRTMRGVTRRLLNPNEQGFDTLCIVLIASPHPPFPVAASQRR
jgi:hypothetical protein